MDSEQVRAACPKCVRLLDCDSVDKAESLIESHNEGMHDGDEVGFVIHETVEDMAEFLNMVHEVATEDEYKSLRMQLAKGDAEVSMVAKEFSEVNELLDHETHQYRY